MTASTTTNEATTTTKGKPYAPRPIGDVDRDRDEKGSFAAPSDPKSTRTIGCLLRKSREEKFDQAIARMNADNQGLNLTRTRLAELILTGFCGCSPERQDKILDLLPTL